MSRNRMAVMDSTPTDKDLDLAPKGNCRGGPLDVGKLPTLGAEIDGFAQAGFKNLDTLITLIARLLVEQDLNAKGGNVESEE